MISVSKIQCIVQMSKEGKSNAEIARTLSISEPTVRKYLTKTDYSPKAPVKRGRKSKMEDFDSIIIEILKKDQGVWKKQRHTATKIYQRLRDEHGCTCSESTVRHRVKKLKAELCIGKEEYLELSWQPGEAQIDFGDVDVCYQLAIAFGDAGVICSACGVFSA